MTSIRIVLAMLVAGAGIACADHSSAPSSDGLTGRWSAEPLPLRPSGELFRSLEFSADGRYVQTVLTRGLYPQQPTSAIASMSRLYGTYLLARDTIHFVPDSLRGWDYLSGGYFQVGSMGGSIEGPPTPPAVELTATHLTLRYMINPGGGYVPVVEEYFREQ